MLKADIKIVVENEGMIPQYMTDEAAGMDICTNIKEPVTLKPLERKLFPTGIKMEIPHGFEVQVRPRSGLALKHGITVLNAPGTIDAKLL